MFESLYNGLAPAKSLHYLLFYAGQLLFLTSKISEGISGFSSPMRS